MEKAIKRRAIYYGFAAVALGLLLCAMVFMVSYPPENQLPSTFGPMKTFTSLSDIRAFLGVRAQSTGMYFFSSDVNRVTALLGPTAFYGISGSTEKTPSFEFSQTNVQVAGVDEDDIVKTDGEYIYTVSYSTVTIVKAYPPEDGAVVAKIVFNESYPVGIFVDGNWLVVLGVEYPDSYMGWINIGTKTFVQVYDITDRASPVQVRNFELSGSCFNSRKIGKYLYVVVNQPAYIVYDTVILPKIYGANGPVDVKPSEIHYVDLNDTYFAYTTVVAVNVEDAGEDPSYVTMLVGGNSNMYASLNNLYLTFHEETAFVSSSAVTDNTWVYRLRIDGSSIVCKAEGKVPGHELNQFSMDEYDGYFRIATTTRGLNGETKNNVYALDMDLYVVGTLEDLAPGETIDSARFIGDRCYLSTSVVRRDPFFVIDVSDPYNPQVLGYLKIPGFTSYLHPYDNDHLIGIGRDGDGHVRVSIFEVSNVSEPIEVASYSVASQWSSTPLLWGDYKAFLFDGSRQLLALPMDTYGEGSTEVSWMGVYVFNINLDSITLRGKIDHEANNYTVAISRTLYIENVLYTVSEYAIKMNAVEDLAPIGTVDLGNQYPFSVRP
jgi:uncharacterized secreted protein with C-terminal beta-propeller domain